MALYGLTKEGSQALLAVGIKRVTKGGNPWHDPRTGKFADAPPGIKLINSEAASILATTTPEQKRQIDSVIRRTGARGIGVFLQNDSEGNEFITVTFVRNGEQVEALHLETGNSSDTVERENVTETPKRPEVTSDEPDREVLDEVSEDIDEEDIDDLLADFEDIDFEDPKLHSILNEIGVSEKDAYESIRQDALEKRDEKLAASIDGYVRVSSDVSDRTADNDVKVKVIGGYSDEERERSRREVDEILTSLNTDLDDVVRAFDSKTLENNGWSVEISIRPNKGDDWVKDDNLEIDATIRDRAGLIVGNMQRTWRVKEDHGNVAYHDYFTIDKDKRSSGIGRELTVSALRMYAKNGWTSVDLDADIDVGGYFWAMMGFDDVNKDDMRLSMNTRVTNMLDEDFDNIRGYLKSVELSLDDLGDYESDFNYRKILKRVTEEFDSIRDFESMNELAKWSPDITSVLSDDEKRILQDDSDRARKAFEEDGYMSRGFVDWHNIKNVTTYDHDDKTADLTVGEMLLSMDGSKDSFYRGKSVLLGSYWKGRFNLSENSLQWKWLKEYLEAHGDDTSWIKA